VVLVLPVGQLTSCSFYAVKNQGFKQMSEAKRKEALTTMLKEAQKIPGASMFTGEYSFTLALPDVCEDGVKRTAREYIVYLLGRDIDSALAELQTVGVSITYSFTDDQFKITVTKPG